MKNIFVIMMLIILASCSHDRRTPKVNIEKTIEGSINYSNLAKLLTDCKGESIVVAIGSSASSDKGLTFHMIVRDSLGICRQYIGVPYDVIKGDTLKR